MQNKKTQEVLHEQHELLRVTLSSIGDAVITTDTRGCVTFLNPAAQSLTGWTLEEASGAPLDALFKIVNEETRRTVENPATRALRDGLVVGLANHTLLIGKDGTERPIDDSAAPIRNTRSEIAGVVLVFRDVTERRTAERAIRLSEERFRLLVEGTKDHAIFMLDPQGHVLTWNPGAERIKGYKAEAIVGQSFCRFYPPEDVRADKPARELKEAVSRGKYEEEGWRVRNDGSRFWASVVFTALQGEGGRLRGFSKVTRDMTERKQAEENARRLLQEEAARSAAEASAAEARRAEKAERAQREQLAAAARQKDEFLAMLAHELRNPPAPLRNALQILKLGGDIPQAVRQVREMMERQMIHLVRLVDDLLDVSRITRGKIGIRRERVSLPMVVQNAIEASGPLIEAGKHQLTITMPHEAKHVVGDPTRLAQVVSNLLNNAAKYTPPEGHIWLTMEQQGDEAVIRVKDTGIGIPVELLSQVFEMFMQVDRSADRSQGGLGIGLTLVKRLVEMHGGTVEARSEGPGLGSEFTIRRPLIAIQKRRMEGDSQQTPEGPSRRVLVVDDNVDAAESLSMMLQLSGHDVRTAHDGAGAIEQAATFMPDVALLDIGMPGMNGYEAGRRVRELPGVEKVVLVALTGWGQEEDRERSKEAGFYAHLVKPVDPAALQELLASLRAGCDG